MTQKGVHNMNKIIVNNFGGGTPHRTERRQCVRAVSETSERRSEVRLIGGDSYGC